MESDFLWNSTSSSSFQVKGFRAISSLGWRALCLSFFHLTQNDGFLLQQVKTLSLSQLLQHLFQVLVLCPLSRTLLRTLTLGSNHTADNRPSVVSSAADRYPLWKLHLWNWLLPSADCQWTLDPSHACSASQKPVSLSAWTTFLRLALLQLHLSLLHICRSTYTPILGSDDLLLQVSSQFCLAFPWWNSYHFLILHSNEPAQ